jgi:hypothetical protein
MTVPITHLTAFFPRRWPFKTDQSGGKVDIRLPILRSEWEGCHYDAGALRDLWSGCAKCLWVRLCTVVPMTPLVAVSDLGGRRYRRFGLD